MRLVFDVLKVAFAIVMSLFFFYLVVNGRFYTDRIFGPPNVLSDSHIEGLDMTVWFRYPNGRLVSLGDTVGEQSCKTIARAYAGSKHYLEYEHWDYHCCTHEGGSNCYRKMK